jgi:hypothetical protein
MTFQEFQDTVCNVGHLGYSYLDGQLFIKDKGQELPLFKYAKKEGYVKEFNRRVKQAEKHNARVDRLILGEGDRCLNR